MSDSTTQYFEWLVSNHEIEVRGAIAEAQRLDGHFRVAGHEPDFDFDLGAEESDRVATLLGMVLSGTLVGDVWHKQASGRNWLIEPASPPAPVKTEDRGAFDEWQSSVDMGEVARRCLQRLGA